MHYYSLPTLLFIWFSLLSFSCTTIKKISNENTTINKLNYIGAFEMPFNYNHNNTTIGGLSGIDYNKKNNLIYLISDDRSEKNAARFYTAKLFFTQKGIDSLIFTSVTNLLQLNGKTYPSSKEDRFKTPDPESIRYNLKTGRLAWNSEGERILNQKDTVLINPAVSIIKVNGKYKSSFILPNNFKMQSTENGPRRNNFEGISFADKFKTLYVNIEEPLYEDAPPADLADNNSFIRIIKFNTRKKKSIAQYAYKLDPVAFKAIPENAFKINGVSEILSIGHNKLLVIERSFSTGKIACTIKIFIADLNNATDISLIPLMNNLNFTAAKKTLLLNMDKLGIYIDNIEGVTFGPQLPNGHKTLLFIADNNFNPLQKSQLLLFEVVN